MKLSKFPVWPIVLFLTVASLQAKEEKVERTKPGLVTYDMPFKGGNVKATFDTRKGDVIRQLLIMNYLVKEHDPHEKFGLPLANGRDLQIKLNMDDPVTRTKLKEIADSYEETFHNKFVIARMNYLGGNIVAIFNTAREEVVSALQKLDQEVDEHKYFVEETFGLLNGTEMRAKLNLNEQRVRDTLKKVALQYSDTPTVVTPNLVTVNMPFKRGTAVAIFDVNKQKVINTLRKLNAQSDKSQPFIEQTFHLWNGEEFTARLNMDDEDVRKTLKNIADEYHEVLQKTDSYLYKMKFANGKVKGTFELNDEKVIETFKALDENVDVNTPYEIKRIPLEDGSVIYVRINTNDPETVRRLKGIAKDYEEALEHIPKQYEVIDLPYLSNIARVVLNVGKEDVLDNLKKLSRKVKDELHVVKNIRLQNGTVLQIKLGINDLTTRAILRGLSDEYMIISNNTDYRYVSKTLPFSNGTAIAIFDVGDSEIIKTLQNLSNQIINPSQTVTEFRLYNGTVLPVVLNMDDPLTRATLKDTAVRYEECVRLPGSNYVTKDFAWKDGGAVAIFDLEKPEVVEGLRNISASIAVGQPNTTHEFPLGNNTVLPVKLDLDEPKIRESLLNLAENYRTNDKPYVPNFKTLNLKWAKGGAVAVYDAKKLSALQGLKDLSGPISTALDIALNGNVTLPVTLNLNNSKTRKALKALAEIYEEYVEPYLPNLVGQIFSSRGKLGVGVFDTNNPEVVRKLQELAAIDLPPGNSTVFSSGAVALNDSVSLIELKKVAEKFEQFTLPDYATVALPTDDGKIVATFDVSKPEVMAGLNALNNTEETEEFSDSHLISLNDGEARLVKLNLKNPITREVLKILAERYEECASSDPKSNFVTKLFRWDTGGAVAVIDMAKPAVIKKLLGLNDETGKGKPEVFPLAGGQNLTVTPNLDEPSAREALSALSEAYQEFIVPNLVSLILEFDGRLASAVYDVNKPKVLRTLKEISKDATEDEPIVTKDIPLNNGEHLKVKYNRNNATVQAILYMLAEDYREIKGPNYVGLNLEFNRGKVATILDLNKPGVLEKLRQLDEGVDLEQPVVTARIPVSRDEVLQAKLNMEDPETRKELEDIADHYNEVLYPSETNLASFELPFSKGFIKVTLDSFNYGVIRELREMTNEAKEDSPGGAVFLVSGRLMPFKVNADDPLTRQRLEDIADKYKEIIKDEPPSYAIKILPHSTGKLVAVLDENEKKVSDTLQMLTKEVDESKPTIKEHLELSNGTTLDFTLNINDKDVRDAVCGVAHACDDIPQVQGPSYVTHNMPFKGGIAVAVFDMNKIDVVEELIKLQNKVAEGEPTITRDFTLEDGSVLQVKLDVDNLETRRALQKIADKYEEVAEIPASRTLILELAYNGGLVICTLDVSNDEVVEQLKSLAIPYSLKSQLVEIPMQNATHLSLNIDVNDPNTRDALKKLSVEYQEVFDPLKVRLVMFKTPFSEGEIIFVIDTARKAVIDKLRKLSEVVGDEDPHLVIRVPLENGTVVSLKLNPDDPDIRKTLANLSAEYDEVLNSTDPHISKHHLRYDGGRVFVTFDLSNPDVISKLKELNGQVKKTESHVTVKLAMPDGSEERVKINLDDPLVRSKLEVIASDYKEITQTASPHHFTYTHYRLPFKEGAVLMTLHTEDPNVLQVLETLDSVAKKRDSALTIRVPLPDGKLKHYKLDLDNVFTRQILQDVAESYEEVIEKATAPSKVVNYEFELDGNKTAKIALDLGKEDVMTTLLELNDEDGEPIELVPGDESGLEIKLDLKNPHTQRELKRIADKYVVVSYEGETNREPVHLTYQLPFKKGKVIVVLDPNDPKVVEKLSELNSKVNATQRRVVLRLPLGDEKLNFRLNMDNPETREALAKVAIEYQEVTNVIVNNILTYRIPFSQGAVELILDMSDPDVIEKLRNLNAGVDETDKYTLLKVPLPDGTELELKLNADDPATRSALEDIALQFKVSWKSEESFVASARNLLQYEMPFKGGKIKFSINPENETAIEELRKLSQKVDVKKRRISIKVILGNGSILNVRLNPDNPDTREALKNIVTEYEEIPFAESSGGTSDERKEDDASTDKPIEEFGEAESSEEKFVEPELNTEEGGENSRGKEGDNAGKLDSSSKSKRI